MSTVPRRALWRPRSLAAEQLGDHPVTVAPEPTPVQTWITWDHAEEELVAAHAIAWTSRAVQVVFGVPPRRFEVWVWASAVTRT